MRKPLVEVLVPATADFILDITVGKGPSARNVKLNLPHFTLVGTTSKPSQVDERLSSLMFVFDFAAYDVHEIGQIVPSLASQQGIAIDSETADLLAEYCNGCPGEASVLLKKVHEYAIAYAAGHITPAIARDALAVFGPKSSSPSRERQPIPDDVRTFVWQRDGGRCAKCGSQENLEYDHIIPVSKGGSNTARNIQLLCEKCNRSKGANIA
jgi:5-methylcytosine-specific restriction endonuclease McrA